jgi:tRNA-binding EMAP/Myf-like protein
VADELVIGTVTRAEGHPGARAPSLLLTVDLGGYGTVEAVLSTGTYDAAELEGTQILCRREADGAVVIGAHSHGKGLVLMRPDQETEPGTVVS